jgi:hypothetical protein
MERKEYREQQQNSNPAGHQQQPNKDGKQSGVEGEGSYQGTKDYNERTKKFVESGKVEDAARAAKPQSEEEAHQMHKAERIGKQHSKGEDEEEGGLAKKDDFKDN